MKTVWEDGGTRRTVMAPVSLIVSAFAPVADVRRTLTAQLRLDCGPTALLLVDLGLGRNRLGASALAQVFELQGGAPADADPALLLQFAAAIIELRRRGLILAYHDRSDGGLFATLVEMAFAGHCGLAVALKFAGSGAIAQLFAEEPGAVLQVRASQWDEVLQCFAAHGLGDCIQRVGAPTAQMRVCIDVGTERFDESWVDLRRAWSETSYQMRRLRDDPECADEEFAAILDVQDPGLSVALSFDPDEDIAAPFIARGARPRVAVLREQGVNSQAEMAAVLDRAGFEAHDVHMSDLLDRGRDLREFSGLVACGGFSYGDVLGAGGGWARSILFHERTRREFARFFERRDTFALGICNGCQMFALLKEIIPGAAHWPRFVRNRSEQFEARFALVQIEASPAIVFAGMHGSRLPIAIAHGEGRPHFSSAGDLQACLDGHLVASSYITNGGAVALNYPANPNGGVQGIAALTTADGRVTITMPHPERVYRAVQNSWYPDGAGEDSGWMRMFRNARGWLG